MSSAGASLCVFTANADHILTTSAVRMGVTIHSYACDPWPGFVTGKLRRGIDFLRARHETYAMWVDGTDTVLQKTAWHITSRYNMLCAHDPERVVISAERNCFPDAYAARYYPDAGLPASSAPRFICAGGFIGRRTSLIKMIQEVVAVAAEDNNEDDQRAWTTAYIRYFAHSKRLVLDVNRRLFSNAGDGDINTETCVVHFNGRTPGREEYWRDLQNE